MFGATNDMLLDMLAAIARRGHKQPRGGQELGIARAKSDGKFQGRDPDYRQYVAINRLLAIGSS